MKDTDLLDVTKGLIKNKGLLESLISQTHFTGAQFLIIFGLLSIPQHHQYLKNRTRSDFLYQYALKYISTILQPEFKNETKTDVTDIAKYCIHLMLRISSQINIPYRLIGTQEKLLPDPILDYLIWQIFLPVNKTELWYNDNFLYFIHILQELKCEEIPFKSLFLFLVSLNLNAFITRGQPTFNMVLNNKPEFVIHKIELKQENFEAPTLRTEHITKYIDALPEKMTSHEIELLSSLFHQKISLQAYDCPLSIDYDLQNPGWRIFLKVLETHLAPKLIKSLKISFNFIFLSLRIPQVLNEIIFDYYSPTPFQQIKEYQPLSVNEFSLLFQKNNPQTEPNLNLASFRK